MLLLVLSKKTLSEIATQPLHSVMTALLVNAKLILYLHRCMAMGRRATLAGGRGGGRASGSNRDCLYNSVGTVAALSSEMGDFRLARVFHRHETGPCTSRAPSFPSARSSEMVPVLFLLEVRTETSEDDVWSLPNETPEDVPIAATTLRLPHSHTVKKRHNFNFAGPKSF